MFNKDDVPTTQTMVMSAVGENPRLRFIRRREQVEAQLQMWQLPKFAEHETKLDYTRGFEMDERMLPFVSFPYLDDDFLKATLPIRGNFLNNYREHSVAHEAHYRRASELSEKRATNVLSERVDELSGRNQLVVDRVKALVTGIWMVSALTNFDKDPKKLQCPPKMRFLNLVETFSWLLAYANHDQLSCLVEDSAGEEQMLVKAGLFLPGVSIEVEKSTSRGVELLKYDCFLRRSPRRDPQTRRFGWVIEPIFTSFLSRNKMPLAALVTPVLDEAQILSMQAR